MATGELGTGRVVEGASVLRLCDSLCNCDISPDVSQPIIELPPLVSSTKRMMFLSTDSSCFPCLCACWCHQRKVQLLLGNWKGCHRLQNGAVHLSKQNFAWKKKSLIPCVQMGSLDAWHCTWFSCLVTCCKDSLLTGVCVGIIPYENSWRKACLLLRSVKFISSILKRFFKKWEPDTKFFSIRQFTRFQEQTLKQVVGYHMVISSSSNIYLFDCSRS